jgi:hypothetical protein
MTVRRAGQAPQNPAGSLACSHETTNKMGEIVDAILARPVFTVRACGTRPLCGPA